MCGQEARERDIGEDVAKGVATLAAASDQAPLKLEQFLPYQLQVVSTLISQALSRVYARRYHLGIPEWRVLATLGFRNDACSAQYIAHCTRTHKSTISRAVTAGQTYFILVDGYDDSEGTFALTVVPPVPASPVPTGTTTPLATATATAVPPTPTVTPTPAQIATATITPLPAATVTVASSPIATATPAANACDTATLVPAQGGTFSGVTSVSAIECARRIR